MPSSNGVIEPEKLYKDYSTRDTWYEGDDVHCVRWLVNRLRALAECGYYTGVQVHTDSSTPDHVYLDECVDVCVADILKYLEENEDD